VLLSLHLSTGVACTSTNWYACVSCRQVGLQKTAQKTEKTKVVSKDKLKQRCVLRPYYGREWHGHGKMTDTQDYVCLVDRLEAKRKAMEFKAIQAQKILEG
jgi:hypothetical protein